MLDDPAGVARFREAVRPQEHPEDWFAAQLDAPLIIAHSNQDAYLDRYALPDKGFTDRSDAWWPAPYWDIDTGFASLLMLLTAVDAGLGACFFGIPARRIGAYRAAFGAPAQSTPIEAISIGYSDEPPRDLSSRRKPMAETVHRSRWNRPGTYTSTGSVIQAEPASEGMSAAETPRARSNTRSGPAEIRKMGSRGVALMSELDVIVIHIRAGQAAEYERLFAERELPRWREFKERGAFLTARISRVAFGTDNRQDVVKYAIVVEVPGHAAHSEHDTDPGFQEFNRLADLLQPEDPLVYGGEVLHAV